MRYFKTQTEIRAIDSDQEFLIESDWIEITLEEVLELNKPTPEELKAQKVAEAKSYLANTDWYYARKMETGEEVPAEVVAKRLEAREAVNGN